MRVTYRQCIHLTNAAEELKGRGGFKFRCAMAGIVMEATGKIQAFNEAQKPAKGMVAFREEISLHRENCTTEKDGKKMINVAAFMPLITKAKATHAKTIAESEKIQADANKALDEPLELSAIPITMEMMEEADTAEKFEVSLLSRLLPFMEEWLVV